MKNLYLILVILTLLSCQEYLADESPLTDSKKTEDTKVQAPFELRKHCSVDDLESGAMIPPECQGCAYLLLRENMKHIQSKLDAVRERCLEFCAEINDCKESAYKHIDCGIYCKARD